MSFDLQASSRRIRPQRRSSPLLRRPDDELLFDLDAFPRRQWLLDTTIYIDRLQRRLPIDLQDRLERRLVNHSSVALAEVTHAFGRLDPAHPGTRALLGRLSALVGRIPVHRLTHPRVQSFGEAGMLAGLAARLTAREHGVELLNDACLLLHAAEHGYVFLTRNIADFDILQQLVPSADVLFYRNAAKG